MKKVALLKYIISSIIVLSTFTFSFGQDSTMYAPKKVKEPLQLKGIKFGANIGRFSDFIFKPERLSYEGSFDFNLSNKYYGIIDIGYSENNVIEDNYHYLSDGYFVKLGLEYNLLKKYPTDFLGVGIKLGRADYNQQAKDVIIETNQWGTYQTDIASINSKTYWLEASLGVKGEIFKNIYLGWAALVRIKVADGSSNNLQPYDIPGFGNGSKKINLGANYYIYYQIPFNRK